MKKSFMIKVVFVFFVVLIIDFLPYSELLSFDISDDKVEELRIKYLAIVEDGILKVKDRDMLYNAGEDLLTREFEDENIFIEAVYQPFEQINNRMNYLLSRGDLDEFTFFDKLYGKNGIFVRYYNKKDYLYFAFRLKSKSGKELDTDKFIKRLRIYDGLDNRVNGEKPKFFIFDEEKKERIYKEKNWDKLPGFEGTDFIWVAFPRETLKEEGGVYYIRLKKFMGAKDIQFYWSLPIKFPVCRCK